MSLHDISAAFYEEIMTLEPERTIRSDSIYSDGRKFREPVLESDGYVDYIRDFPWAVPDVLILYGKRLTDYIDDVWARLRDVLSRINTDALLHYGAMREVAKEIPLILEERERMHTSRAAVNTDVNVYGEMAIEDSQG